MAKAHYRAAFVEAAGGRNIVFGDGLGLGGLAEMLKTAYGDTCPFPIQAALPEGTPAWKADNG